MRNLWLVSHQDGYIQERRFRSTPRAHARTEFVGKIVYKNGQAHPTLYRLTDDSATPTDPAPRPPKWAQVLAAFAILAFLFFVAYALASLTNA